MINKIVSVLLYDKKKMHYIICMLFILNIMTYKIALILYRSPHVFITEHLEN